MANANLRPQTGGGLFSALSRENAGLANYATKRDWRRTFADREGQAEGHDLFWPLKAGAFEDNPGTQPFPLQAFADPGPVNLIHQIERPNGKTALVAGTPTALYRFVGLDQTAVFEAGVYEVGVYGSDLDTGWTRIAAGFSPSGRRWEAVNSTGFAIFNNGVDVPVSIRVEELEARPLWELRELGIVSVGTIGMYSDILVWGAPVEMEQDVFLAVMRPQLVMDSGAMWASQPGNPAGTTLSVQAPYFSVDDVGKTIVFDDGIESDLTAFIDDMNVSVSAHSHAIDSQPFTMRVRASQVGAIFSGEVSASITAGTAVVLSDGDYFDAGMVGSILRFANGWSGVIASFTSGTQVALDTEATETFTALPFYISPASAYLVIAAAPVFSADMVGLALSFDAGEERRILEVMNPTTVRVDSDVAQVSDLIAVENPHSYEPWAIGNRVQYRIGWASFRAPRRMAVNYYGRIEEGSNILRLDYPVKSLESGQEIVVSGAGVNGSNLTTTILYIAGGRVINLLDVAQTTNSAAVITQSDMLGSISAYDDPGDYSGVIRISELGGVMVVYKEDSVVLGALTGQVEAPFSWRTRGVPTRDSLYYRNTLVNVGGEYHVYAGMNAFMRFDLTSQRPVIFTPMEPAKDLFYERAGIEDTDAIFAADNTLTREFFWVTPAQRGNNDAALCFDYQYGTCRTTSAQVTAAASIKRVGPTLIEGTDWFVMANEAGVLLLYGLSAEPVDSWGGAYRIYYRRDAYPYHVAKRGYECVLQTGLGDFGHQNSEKQVTGYTLMLASMSPKERMRVEFLTSLNATDEPEVIDVVELPDPGNGNFVPMGFIGHHFGERLIIPPMIRTKPIEFSQRNWEYFYVVGSSRAELTRSRSGSGARSM